MSLIEQEANHLLNKRNVVAVGLGKKWAEGQETNDDALLVFVSNKEDPTRLNKKHMVPKKISGMCTDVVGRTGMIQALELTGRYRPVMGGASCGHIKVTAGTMGCWFKDKDGDVVGLSNNHVLAWENLAKDMSQKGGGHLVVQPGVYDDPNWRSNKIGQLKAYKRLSKKGNFEDSAVALPNDLNLVESEIFHIGQPVGWNDAPKIGDVLQKSGRTTGYTQGKIIATDAVVNVQYSSRLGVLQFKDQILTSGMSAGGDSGSCILDMSNNVVGLLFAGSPTVTVISKIKYPRETYGLKIYNPEPFIEDFSYTLTVDGKKETGSTPSAYIELLNKARHAARAGSKVNLIINYSN